MEELFFELIRVAIGTEICLTHFPTANEWGKLYEAAKKQTLLGVCFAGVQKLPENVRPQEMLNLTWMGMAAKIQQRNELLNRRCLELQTRLSVDGMFSSILKGQGIGTLYGELAGLRQSGDIDIWVSGGSKNALQYARERYGGISYDYINVHLPMYEDTDVELHWRVQYMSNLLKNRRLQMWVSQNEDLLLGGKVILSEGKELIVPTLDFNRVYILLHCYHHVLESGLGLRQLMDLYFVLKASDAKSTKTCLNVVKQLGMIHFAKGIMWLLAHVFENTDDICPWMICEPSEKEGRFLLKEVMAGGNFGHHDSRVNDLGMKGIWKDKVIQLQHVLLIASHYPSEVFWTPVWFVYHKLWKWFGKE